jgi:hypothetical protein
LPHNSPAEQPRARERPAALQCRGGHAHHVGGLFDAHAGEIAELDDLRLLGIDFLEPAHRLVERRQHRLGIGRQRQ